MKTTLRVKGMHCAACTERVAAALRRVPGVVGARAALTPPRAEIETDGSVSIEALNRAAGLAGGYSVEADGAAPGTGAAPARRGVHAEHVDPGAPAESTPSLYPLVLIVVFIAGTAALTTYFRAAWDWHTFMNDFMAGFFLVFSFFKLLDLRGFADAYRSYDVLANRWPAWGLVYPFIELALGIAYLIRWQPVATNVLTLVLMLTGSIGVLRAVLRKDRIRCACLGTAINLPMTTVTLFEDLAMAAMAAAMLLWTR